MSLRRLFGRPLGVMDLLRRLIVTSSPCWTSTLGCGLVEVTQCYLVTFLVVHLVSASLGVMDLLR